MKNLTLRIAVAALGAAVTALAAPSAGLASTEQVVANAILDCQTQGVPQELVPSHQAGVTVPGQTYTVGPYSTAPITAGTVQVLPSLTVGPFSQTVPSESPASQANYGTFSLVAISACGAVPASPGAAVPTLSSTRVCFTVLAQADLGGGAAYYPLAGAMAIQQCNPSTAAGNTAVGAAPAEADVHLPIAGSSVTIANNGSTTTATSTGTYMMVAYTTLQVNGAAPTNTCPVLAAFDCDAVTFQSV